MKILVTGGTGFIGSHLTKKLHEKYNKEDDVITTLSRNRKPGGDNSEGYFFHTPAASDSLGFYQKDLNHITLNLADIEGVRKALVILSPDIIFHLAGNPNIKQVDNNPKQIFNDNVISTLNICHNAPKGCKIVLSSSVVVYSGNPINRAFTEKEAPNPISLYGTTKIASEGIINTYTHSGDIDGKILRLCATVGKGLTHGILHDFVKKLKSDSRKLEVLGKYPGSNKPFSYIDDVVSALIQSINLKLDTPVNIVPDDTIFVNDVAMTVMREMGIGKPTKWLGEKSTWKGDNKIIKVDNKVYTDIFERKFKTSEEAISQAVKDIINGE